MTEQEIRAVAKTNWLAWQGLRELQPEVAAWMESQSARNILLYDDDGNFTGKVYDAFFPSAI